jgi:hypothetical protein
MPPKTQAPIPKSQPKVAEKKPFRPEDYATLTIPVE